MTRLNAPRPCNTPPLGQGARMVAPADQPRRVLHYQAALVRDGDGERLSPLGDRWLHVQGVARQAQRVAAILPAEDRDVLLAAAYLHDLGCAPPLAETGLHPLDGARHLRALGYGRLAGLVAYHS